jgi:hypothetical protein
VSTDNPQAVIPVEKIAGPLLAGRTPEANELALAKAWPEAIAFVLQHSR